MSRHLDSSLIFIAIGIVLIAAILIVNQITGPASTEIRINRPVPHWNCDAEDEVVVIDHTCRHIDELHTP